MMSFLSSVIGFIISIIRFIFSFIFRLEEKMKKNRLMIAEELDRVASLYKEIILATDSEGGIDDEKILELDRICERNQNRWYEIIESSVFYELPDDVKNNIEKALHVVHYAPGSIAHGLNEARFDIKNKKLNSGRVRNLKSSIDKLENIAVRLRLSS